MQKGTIWGHGSYLAPDWSADWLHREAMAMLDIAALAKDGRNFDSLDKPSQAALAVQLPLDLRANTWDAASGVIRIGPRRQQAIAQVAQHYADVFQARDSEASRDLARAVCVFKISNNQRCRYARPVRLHFLDQLECGD